MESVHDECIEQAKEIPRNKAENASQFFLATYTKVQREGDELRNRTFSSSFPENSERTRPVTLKIKIVLHLETFKQ